MKEEKKKIRVPQMHVMPERDGLGLLFGRSKILKRNSDSGP